MESFKGNALGNISRATAIICEFQSQVIVLKSTGIIAQLRPRRVGFTRRMIDLSMTNDFCNFCNAVAQAKTGNKNVVRQVLARGEEADRQLQSMDFSNYAKTLEGISKVFTAEELKVLRTDKPMTDELAMKLFSQIFQVAMFLLLANPYFKKMPSLPEALYTLVFRIALAGYLMSLRWIEVGGATNVKLEKIRN